MWHCCQINWCVCFHGGSVVACLVCCQMGSSLWKRHKVRCIFHALIWHLLSLLCKTRLYWISWFVRPRYSNTSLSASAQKHVEKLVEKRSLPKMPGPLLTCFKGWPVAIFCALVSTYYTTMFCDMCHFHLELLGLVISVSLFILLIFRFKIGSSASCQLQEILYSVQ